MECYRVLLADDAGSGYRGIHRLEPVPEESASDEFLSLFYRSCEYCEHSVYPGTTTELSIHELRRFAELSSQITKKEYEIVCINEDPICSYPAKFYGIDVAGEGGYSMLAEGLFLPNSPLTKILNQFFLPKLNQFGLFDALEDATLLKDLLFQLNQLHPGFVDRENWKTYYIYKIL